MVISMLYEKNYNLIYLFSIIVILGSFLIGFYQTQSFFQLAVIASFLTIIYFLKELLVEKNEDKNK
jgi:4-hydroxybenzoate polyprenyltransferase